MPPKPRGLWQSLSDRVERSQHVFLAGLVVALAIEVVVDWNATFYEINVLRAQLGAKATHYVAILRVALEDPLAVGGSATPGSEAARAAQAAHVAVDELASRVLEDDEVLYVRVARADGSVMAEAGQPLGARYPHQLDRDVRGLLEDPQAFRARIARSRHRDIFQAITDTEDRALAAILPASLVTPPPPPSGSAARIALQDRLYDEQAGDKREDRRAVWSLALIDAPGRAINDGPAVARGVVLVALDTRTLHAAIRKKLLKGLAITVFFLGLIGVQQVSARRSKMRLISLRDALASARAAIAGALPAGLPKVQGLDGALAFRQAERLGGTIYDVHSPGPGRLDLFLALPEGSGVDVAFASVLLHEMWARLRAEHEGAAPAELLGPLARLYGEATIHRRLSLCLLRIDAGTGGSGGAGDVRGALVGMEAPLCLGPAGTILDAEISPLEISDAAAQPGLSRFDPPLRRFRLPLPVGATLVLHDDGLPSLDPETQHALPRPELAEEVRRRSTLPMAGLVAELERQTLRRAEPLQDDVFILCVRREG